MTSPEWKRGGLGCGHAPDFHVAVALDNLGRRLGEMTVPTTDEGLCEAPLLGGRVRTVRCVGIEGTSSYGAGTGRYLRARRSRLWRSRGQSAVTSGAKASPTPSMRAAARAVLAGETAGVPKSADGRVGMIRALRIARRSAVKARSQAANQLQALLVTAPEDAARPSAQAPDQVARHHRLASVRIKQPDAEAATKLALCSWPAVTWPSRRRSPNSMSSWIGW